MSRNWNLTSSFRDLPVTEHINLPRRLSSELNPNSRPIEATHGQLKALKRNGIYRNSVMFSCTLPACSQGIESRKESKRAKELERKKSLSKGKDRYTIVKGLAGGPDGISFESLFKKKHFLRTRNKCLILELYDDSEEYRKQATFLPLQDMWFFGYIVFESLLEPAHFIRRCNEQLVLQKYENSQFFKEDASFKLARKRCIACVKIGSRVWAKAEKGCFLRGIVLAVDDEVHIKLESGDRVKHKRNPAEVAFVPDIIPHPLEIEVGTRVLARWFNRHETYYPATVTAVRRTYFDVRYDDGDKGSNMLAEVRLLKQPEVEGGTSIPSWSSLAGLPRVGGLCIDASESQTEATTTEQWNRLPQDSAVERDESPSDPDTDRELHFGYENNFQYLSPANNNCQYQHAPVERNISQVSGSSCDSGYHGSARSSRQRKTGLWGVSHSKDKEHGVSYDSRFLSPFSYVSNFHIPGLSDDKRNLSELSVSSSVDSGYLGGSSRLDMPPLAKGLKATSCPGKAVQVYKNSQESSWHHSEEPHDQQLSDNETSNSTTYSTNHDTDYSEHYGSNCSTNFDGPSAAHQPLPNVARTHTTKYRSRSFTTDDAQSKGGSEISSRLPRKFSEYSSAKFGTHLAPTAPKENGIHFAKNGTRHNAAKLPRDCSGDNGCNAPRNFTKANGISKSESNITNTRGANGALVDRDMPRYLGMETVI